MSASRDPVDLLRDYIESEQFRVGERIGSERALAEDFKLSRSEVRRALAVLEGEGEVRRTIGSAGGVFRWDGKFQRQLNTIEGVPSMLRQQGFVASTTVIASHIGLARPDEYRALGLRPGENVLRVERRRDADGTPLSLDRMSLPINRFPGLHSADLSQGVYAMLAESYDVHPSTSSEAIDVAQLSADDAHKLNVAAGASVFSIRRVTYDQSGRAFEYAHDLFLADRTRITLRRVGARWKRAGSSTRS